MTVAELGTTIVVTIVAAIFLFVAVLFAIKAITVKNAREQVILPIMGVGLIIGAWFLPDKLIDRLGISPAILFVGGLILVVIGIYASGLAKAFKDWRKNHKAAEKEATKAAATGKEPEPTTAEPEQP